MEDVFNTDTQLRDEVIKYLYTEVFSKTYDDIPTDFGILYSNVYSEIKNLFQTIEYNKVYDLIEGFICAFNYAHHYEYYKRQYIRDINDVFKEENVNYRIINDEITDIIDENQIESIEETLQNKNKPVVSHYSKAIQLLYSVKDYDNSIKESISTVEAMCQIITGNDKAILSDALKLLKGKIHPALNGAFDKLYGYTSDANGIRHANGLGEGDSTFEEAKYMLISCSAFVNYLKEKFDNKED